MSCMILDLQRNSIDSKCSVSTLLRQALAIAHKLDINEIVLWLKNELNGYHTEIASDKIPAYRTYKCILQGLSPYYGWRPIVIKEHDFENKLLEGKNYQSVPELEKLISGKAHGNFLELLMTGSEVLFINQVIRDNVNIRKLVPVSFIEKTLNYVRNLIMEWALDLEKQGIIGVNMIFSNDEKQRAQNNFTINIDQYNGIIGDVIHSTVSQQITIPFSKGDFEGLKKFLLNKGLDINDVTALQNAINEDPEPTDKSKFGGNVSIWLGKMLSKAAEGLWSTSIETAATELIKALNYFYYG